MSFEKFIADEDLCGSIKKLIAPVEFSEDAFAMDLIKELGTLGNYLVQHQTLERCRTEFFEPTLNIRTNHDQWLKTEIREVEKRAGEKLNQRLLAYQKPDIDPSLERELIRYVDKRKGNG